MKRTNLIIVKLLVTAFACSPCFGQDVIASIDLPLTQEVLNPETIEASAPLAIATRPLRAGAIIQEADFVIEGGAPEAVAYLKEIIIGKEARRTIYPGKPVVLADLGSATVIKRNAVVTIEFARGPLIITTDGRALDQGGVGDSVRVMNLRSKIILSGIVVGANKVVTQ